MTILQAEMTERGKTIKKAGGMMLAGTITPETESIYQRMLAALITENEDARKMQEQAFDEMPWLRHMAERTQGA